MRLQSQMVSARVARGAVAEAADVLGAEKDEKGHYKDPSWGTVGASKVPYSDTRQKMNALRLTLIAEVGKAQIGGALTEHEAQEMKEQLQAASTPGEWGAILRHYDHTMKQVEKSVVDVSRESRTAYDSGDK